MLATKAGVAGRRQCRPDSHHDDQDSQRRTDGSAQQASPRPSPARQPAKKLQTVNNTVPAMTAIQAAIRMVHRRHRRPAGSGRCQEQLGLPFPLVEANAENVTVPDGSIDPLSASTRRAYVGPSTLRRGGGSASPARWTPRVPDQQRPGDGVCAGGRRTLGGLPAAAPQGMSRINGLAAGSNSIQVMATGFASSANAGSWSKPSRVVPPGGAEPDYYDIATARGPGDASGRPGDRAANPLRAR
jgi:hypothetical protein